MFMYPSSGEVLVIGRPKLGVLEHVGVLLPDNTVMHCTPERGTHWATVEEFAQGHDVRVVREVPPELCLVVMQRAYWIEMNPQRWDIINFNCYHLVNWLTAKYQPAAILN
jgi:hypothetical protein